ncbi:MAG: glycosyl hydrolase [Actinomycetales bacterium]|nr:glycosyl hydrolase [Actinomycetales bacterium]
MSAESGPREATPGTRPWLDPILPDGERVRLLVDAMTLDEKLAQLGSVWGVVDVDADGRARVSPRADDEGGTDRTFAELTRHGIGQLTRVYGTRPVEPRDGARALAAVQRDLRARTRLGIPAMVHEECLSGLIAFRAAAFPTPLAWAASFDPATIEQTAAAIGHDLRALGVHQGLAPVVDVVRDARWGRVEETLGEDPYLAGVLAAAYVRGLESAGVVATLKHFAGYSASRAGRNLAPVSMGPREFADVVLPPFEHALRAGARSVMHAYTAVDGLPAAADQHLLTTVLREELGFRGVVVADYFGITFLETHHRVASSPGDAAAQALTAGVDVELPTTRCYGEPLAERVQAGDVAEELVDRAVTRVLRQKVELGLLDRGWDPESPVLRAARGETLPTAGEDALPVAGEDALPVAGELDSPAHRVLARRLAERSVILLANVGEALPLTPGLSRLAVVGPCADDPSTLLGAYSFVNHVGPHHPGTGSGIAIPTVLDALRADLPDTLIEYARGCDVDGTDRSGFDEAVRIAAGAGLCLVVLGDQAGLFGGGTSGEGCDVGDLTLPGVQGELLEVLLGTGVPVVLVTISGRPYAVGAWNDRLAAHLQAFFPGEEGGRAVAAVLSGRIAPSGRLPVQIPRHPGGQPATYLHAPLGDLSGVSSADPTPVFPFGHGLTYTTFAYGDLQADDRSIGTDGETVLRCTVTNTGSRRGTEVVQLYLSVPVAAEVTRPVRQLIGFARVTLDPGHLAQLAFTVHADRTACTGRDLRRTVTPGRVELLVGPSSAVLPLRVYLDLVGDVREVGSDRVLVTPVRVTARRSVPIPAPRTGEDAVTAPGTAVAGDPPEETVLRATPPGTPSDRASG